MIARTWGGRVPVEHPERFHQHVIRTDSPRLAAPVGPFSHAVRAGGLVYLSGQVGQDPVTGKLVDGDVVQQSRQIFTNVRSLLDEFGMSLDDVVKVNVLLVDIDHFAAVNEVYAEQFTAPYPARTAVAVKQLPLGALIEIEMIARAS